MRQQEFQLTRFRLPTCQFLFVVAYALSQSVELYVIDASLRAHPEPKLREKLLAIPTAFTLPADEVDELVSAARRILRGSAEFDRLLRDLSATRIQRSSTIVNSD